MDSLDDFKLYLEEPTRRPKFALRKHRGSLPALRYIRNKLTNIYLRKHYDDL